MVFNFTHFDYVVAASKLAILSVSTSKTLNNAPWFCCHDFVLQILVRVGTRGRADLHEMDNPNAE